MSAMPMTKLRPLGALEKYVTMRSNLGIYNNVAVTCRYKRQRRDDLKSALFSALAIVIPPHPILSAIPMDTDTIFPYFARLLIIDFNQVVEFVDCSQYKNIGDLGGSFAVDRFPEEQHNRPFEYTTPLSPFWRLYVSKDIFDASSFTISFFFHHCIADTKSALVFHEALEAALSIASEVTPDVFIKTSELPLLPPVDQFLSSVSAIQPTKYQDWDPAEWTGAKQFTPAKTNFRSYWLSADTTGRMIGLCKEKQLPLTAVLQTMLVSASFRLLPKEYTVVKADCAVSLRPWLPSPINAKSIGCFVDNFCTKYDRGPFNWPDALRTKETIDRILQQRGGDNLCSKLSQIHDLRPWFEKKMGQARPCALEMSNVGKLAPLTASRHYEIETLIFSQSAGACSGAIKVSAATGRDNRLILGFSWQEGVVEDEMIENLISGLNGKFHTALNDQQSLT